MDESTAAPSQSQADTPLAAALAELGRHDPAVREAVAARLREQGDHLRRSGGEALDASHPVRRPSEPMTPARAARAVLALLLLAGGFFGFWYAMAVGVPHKSAPGGHDPALWGVARYAWCGLLAWMLARDLKRDRRAEAWAVARRVTPTVVSQNVLVLAVIVGVAALLDRLFPALDRSWLYLLPGLHGHATNIALMPVQIKYFGIAFLLLFALSVPRLAEREERSYRRGTRNWKHGVFRSLRFGLAHCVSGVPLYMGLALTVGGLWFTLQYFRGGVERSTLHHATYNWIVTFAVLAAVILWTVKG